MSLRHFLKHLTLTSSYGFSTLSCRFIHPPLTLLFTNSYSKRKPLTPTKISLPFTHCYTSVTEPQPSTLISPYLSIRIRCRKDIAVSFNSMIHFFGGFLIEWMRNLFFLVFLGLFRICFLKLLCALVQVQLLWMKMTMVTLLMRLPFFSLFLKIGFSL